MKGWQAVINGLVALAAALSAPQAQATPPDAVTIEEQPFALSQRHLLLIRTANDNLGTYEMQRIESFLVAIDLASGAEQSWVLDRMTGAPRYDEKGALLGYRAERDRGLGAEQVNPYAIAARFDAVPWAALRYSAPSAEGPQITSSGEMMTITTAPGAVYRISTEALRAEAKRRINAMGEKVAEHKRMSTLSTRELYAMQAEAGADAALNCTINEVLAHRHLAAKPRDILARALCTDEEGAGSIGFIMPLAPASAPPR